MKFTPDKKDQKQTIYFEDVSSEAGYAGHATDKSEDTLIAEITTALNRLNAKLMSWSSGTFTDDFGKVRDGFIFEFFMQGPDGNLPGVIRVAALPLRNYTVAKAKQARKAALFQLRDKIVSDFRFEKISVNYSTIVPFMLNDRGETVSEAWLNKFDPGRALPSPVE